MKKRILYLAFLFTVILLTFYILDKNNISISNKFTLELFNNSFDYANLNNKKNINLRNFFNVNSIINYEYRTLYYKNSKNDLIPIYNNNKESTIVINEKKDIEQPITESKEKFPLVYIYNTHNKEEYKKDSSPHSIKPTVVTVSYMLKEQLESYGIISIVEEKKVSDVLSKNKWNYASSYRASRGFLSEAKKINSSLEFFIDVHRDSVKKSISTIEINKKSYAKIMFVLGLENKNYNENLHFMEYLDKNIKKDYPGLSRGIYKKKGPTVNGIYNQDFSKNCILIEFGGNENTLEEVYNTSLVVSKYLSLYIGDYNEGK